MPNEITISKLSLLPTLKIGSVIADYTGDDNHAGSAQVSYRETGGSWRKGVFLANDYREEWRPGSPNPYKNQFRGCIFGLKPGTSYEVMVTTTDIFGFIDQSPVGVMITWDDDPPSIGNTYWVSPTGNDSNPGTESSQWQTLVKARDTVQPGDTVMVTGTHSGRLWLTASGLPDNYITWRSADFNNKALLTYSGTHGPFHLDGVSYNRFRGLEVENTNTSGRSCFFLTGSSPTSGNIIEDCLIRPEGSPSYWCSGICLDNPNADHTIIRRNIFRTALTGSDEGPFALMRTKAVEGTLFYDNLVSGHFGDAINTGLNLNGHAYNNIIIGVNDDGLELEYSGICCSAFENKITEGLYSDIAVASVRHGPTYIMRNIAFGPHRSGGGCSIKQGSSGDTDGWVSTGFVYFYHNDFAPSQVDAIAGNYGGGRIYNQVFRNNIMRHYGGGAEYVVENSNTSSPVPCDFDYNCMFSGRSAAFKWLNNVMNWADWRAGYGMEVHGIWADPMLVDIANGDARLQDGSPCVDAGEIIPGINDADSPWPFQGNAPDIGAVESGLIGSPQAAFTVDIGSGNVPLNVQFTNKSMGGIDTYHWDFGDGGISYEISPAHKYMQAGVFEVTLTVNGPGGSDVASLTIEAIQTHILSLTAGEGGTTDPVPGDYPIAGIVRLTALPDSDYRFIGWEQNGNTFSTEYIIDVFMDSDKAIHAVFEYVEPPPGEFVVTITALGGGITSPPVGEVTVIEGNTLEITAYPVTGFQFDHWEGDVSGTNSAISFIVQSNMSVVAVFVAEPTGPPGLPSVLWGLLPFFPWVGPPLPRFSGMTWEKIQS